jgi:hypothetical protein
MKKLTLTLKIIVEKFDGRKNHNVGYFEGKSDKSTIESDAMQKPHDQILTLYHEFSHWLAFAINKILKASDIKGSIKLTSEQEEAFCRGIEKDIRRRIKKLTDELE